MHRKRNAPLTLVVNINVPDDVILCRISDRWIHLPSGRVYNMSYNRPRVEGFDDQTGEPLTRRPDDNLVSLFPQLPFPFLTFLRMFSLDDSNRSIQPRHHC
jgi:adenylate kinase family enzyme